jgi:hypothetical protein
MHKFNLLNASNLLAKNARPTISHRLDNRTNNIYTKYSIKTRTVGGASFFKEARNLFYPQPENLKIVPSNINELLTTRGLAYWYMDDGGRNSGNLKNKGMVFDVSNFVFDDQLKLKHVLETKFLCAVTIHKRNTSYKNTKLYIRASSAEHFCNLVRPYIIPSMFYKFARQQCRKKHRNIFMT